MTPNLPDQLSDRFIRFIEEQHMFFVATAAPDGRVNLSPKGLDTLRVLSPTRIVWLSLSGSGNARSMDSGVSRATIPTMAGMVGALSGVFLITLLTRRVEKEVELLEDSLTMEH